MELPSHFEAKYITRCSVLQGTCQNMPVMTPPLPLPPREHGQPVSYEGLTTKRSAWRRGGGSTALASGMPLSILEYLGFVVCVVWDLMKEGCAHRGIYSVHRDRGLKFEWDCEGPLLRCLPGLCLHLGERNWAGTC